MATPRPQFCIPPGWLAEVREEEKDESLRGQPADTSLHRVAETFELVGTALTGTLR